MILVFGLAGCATAPHGAFVEPMSARPVAPRPDSVDFVGRNMFIWPVTGEVIFPFSAKKGRVKNKGIDINADEGESVVASRSGKVVYLDEGFKGYGKTVILDHGNGYQTVYAYNSDILVDIGKTVNQKERIAKVGKTGRAKRASLHFEIRKNGEPQNPLSYLPR